jgi:hypothetical protein
MTKEKPRTAVAPPYKPTPAETAAMNPDLGTGTVNLLNAFGTASLPFMQGLLGQITNVASQGQQPDEANINFVLAVVNGIEPRDEVEAMLGAQMAAVHMATMTFARRLAHVENIPQQDAAERALNKLGRTFTTQMEALKRYRSTGQQTVRVERVSVEAGGQAIVGSVTTSSAGGGGDHGK